MVGDGDGGHVVPHVGLPLEELGERPTNYWDEANDVDTGWRERTNEPVARAHVRPEVGPKPVVGVRPVKASTPLAKDRDDDDNREPNSGCERAAPFAGGSKAQADRRCQHE